MPESVVLGTTLVAGSGVSWAILAAVFLSNLPESMAATTGLLKSGARPSQLMLLWGATTLVSGIAAGLGYTLLGDASGATVALVQAFAAGALLTMLTDTMIPEAYEHSGPATGLVTVLGFTVAFGISTLARRPTSADGAVEVDTAGNDTRHAGSRGVRARRGATAGKAVFGPSFRVTRQRVRDSSRPSPLRHDLVVVATIHPSAVLRSRDRTAMYDGLVSDLRVVAEALG